LPAESARDSAELADHIDDSIAAIQAEGRDLDFATGEAWRAWVADELARQLRRATGRHDGCSPGRRGVWPQESARSRHDPAFWSC